MRHVDCETTWIFIRVIFSLGAKINGRDCWRKTSYIMHILRFSSKRNDLNKMGAKTYSQYAKATGKTVTRHLC